MKGKDKSAVEKKYADVKLKKDSKKEKFHNKSKDWDNQDGNRVRDWGRDRGKYRDIDRDSYGRDSYSRDSYSRESYGRDSYDRESYSRNSYGRDSYGRNSYAQDSYSRNSNRDNYGRNMREREKYRGRERERERDRKRNRERDRGRDRERDRRDRDREKRRASPSRSRSSSTERRMRRKTRKSGWDQAPTAQDLIANAMHPSRIAALAVSGMGGLIGNRSIPGLAHAAQLQQHATRTARKLYVGNLPVPSTEDELKGFFNLAMKKADPGSAQGEVVLSVYLNLEKRFGFLEFRSIEEATAGMNLDGIVFKATPLRIRRPSNYNPDFAHNLVGNQAPTLDLTKLGIINTHVSDGPNKIYCGGLPHILTDDEVKELLSAYGELKSFHLVRDQVTSVSKGFCFFEYKETDITDDAIEGLDGIEIGPKTLSVRRTQPHDNNKITTVDVSNPLIAVSNVPVINIPHATRILVLTDMLSKDDLSNNQVMDEIVEDVRQECSKSGKVVSVVAPRYRKGKEVYGVGKIFVKFENPLHAAHARTEVEGRKFGEDESHVVKTFYMDENEWFAKINTQI